MGALDGQRVEILIEAVNRATATFDKVADDLKKMKTQAKETQQAFSGFGDLIGKAFGTYAIYQFAGAVKDATSAVLNWMGDMETYGIAIASSLQVGGQYVEKISGKVLEGAQAFKAAQNDAKGVIESLQVANFQTVATLDQLIRMYQEALPIAMKKGFDKKMVQDFTLSVTQAASAMGISLDMMAEEARSLLTGAINMRNSRVAVALGITPEDVRQNSASATQLFDFLMGKLQVYRQAGEALQNSWRGVWSNFKDVMMQAGGKALEPLFEGIKQQLKDIIDSVVTLDKEAGKIIWNPEFLAVLDSIKNGIINLMNIWTAFRESVESSTFFKAMQLGWKAAGAVVEGVADAVNDPGSVARGWWEKTKAGLNSPDDKTVWTEGFLGISNPWKKENVQKREWGILNNELRSVNATQTIARNTTGLSDKERFQGMIWGLSKKYGVDPYEISSLIESESGFRNTITKDNKGGVGAIGLGQLRLPALTDLGLDPLSAVDPAKNIEGVIRYYLGLKKAVGGDKEQARMAYKEGLGFLQSHFSATPKARYQEGDEYITDYDKYVRGSRNAAKAQKLEDEQRKLNVFGKDPKADFEPSTTMSEVEKEATQKSFEGNIAEIKRKYQLELDAAKQAGQTKKALDKAAEVDDESKIKNKEERAKFELEVDQETTQKQLEIKQDYLKDYTAWTDQLAKINVTEEGSAGVYKDAEERTKALEKTKDEKARITREMNQLETDLVVQGAGQRKAINDGIQKDLEADYGARAKLAQNEYNDLKKINDIEVGAGRKTDLEAFEEENEARQKLIRTQLEEIAVKLQAQGLGDKEIGLRAKQADLIDEYDKKELTAAERRKLKFQQDMKVLKSQEDLIQVQIHYNEVIGDPEAVQALSVRLEISKLLTAAYAAEYYGQTELAEQYRKTAAAVAELNRGDSWFVGLKKGMKDLKESVGTLSENFATLFKGMVTGFTGSLGTMLSDWLKFDGNFMKDLDALKDYWKDFWGKMVGVFVQFLEALLIKWLASKFLQMFSSGEGISLSLGGGGGGGGGLGGILGLLGKGKEGYDLYNTVSGWFGGGGSTAAALAANPSLGADFAGVAGADMGIATTGVEGMSYGVGVGEIGTGTGAMVGAEVAGEGALSGLGGVGNMAWLGPAAFAAGWLYTAYKVYEGAQDMAANNEAQAKQIIAGGYGSLKDMAGDFAGQESKYDMWGPSGGMPVKTLSEGSSDQEKMAFIQSYREEMRLYGEEAKLTREQVDALVKEALGPANATLLAGVDAANASGQAIWDLSGDFKAGQEIGKGYKDAVQKIHTEIRKADDPIKALTESLNLNASFSAQAQAAIDGMTTTMETAQSAGMNTAATIQLLSDTIGLSADQIQILSEAFDNSNSGAATVEATIKELARALNIGYEAARDLAVALELIPREINTTLTIALPEGQINLDQLRAQAVTQNYHKGGFIKYHPFGGGLRSDEIPFIGQSGEYVLSRKDVEFINKVKGTGGGIAEIVSIPPVLPRVNVVVNNQSGARVESAGAVRYSEDEYIIDVLLKDLHSGGGRLRSALSFT